MQGEPSRDSKADSGRPGGRRRSGSPCMRLSGVPNSQRSYQTAGECCLQMHHGDEVQDYRRELELAEGISRVAYTVQGVRYIRESYVSYPENCMVMVLRTEDGTAFSFDCLLGRCHNATDEVEKVR